MPISIQAAIVTLLTSIVSVAVGFGIFNTGTEQILVAAIGPIVGSIVSIVAVIDAHGKAIAAGQLAASKATYQKVT